MWFSESQMPRALPPFGPITSAGETRFGSFSCWRYLFKKNSPRFPIWKNVFPFNDGNVISGIWQSWLWKSRGRLFFKSRATISGILRPRDASSGARAQARVQRNEHVDHVLMQLIFPLFPTPAAICSQFFLRNNLFCSKIRTTRRSGALGHPKKKTFILSRNTLRTESPSIFLVSRKDRSNSASRVLAQIPFY